MTRSSEDVHFIVVSTTQSLKTAPLTIGSQNVWDWSHEYHISGYVGYVGYSFWNNNYIKTKFCVCFAVVTIITKS